MFNPSSILDRLIFAYIFVYAHTKCTMWFWAYKRNWGCVPVSWSAFSLPCVPQCPWTHISVIELLPPMVSRSSTVSLISLHRLHRFQFIDCMVDLRYILSKALGQIHFLVGNRERLVLWCIKFSVFLKVKSANMTVQNACGRLVFILQLKPSCYMLSTTYGYVQESCWLLEEFFFTFLWVLVAL